MKLALVIMLGWCIGFSCTNPDYHQNPDSDASDLSLQDFPKWNLLNDLPDSLQPRTVYLDQAPAPVVIPIAQKKTSRQRISLPDGKQQWIDLEPPKVNSLPVIRDENGKLIQDESGHPYYLGEGNGISSFTNFTTDNGLPFNVVESALKDRRGNLWFGTFGGGVCCYDGQKFTTYAQAHGLRSNIVWDIEEDQQGNLWFGTYGGGASKFDGQQFTNYTMEQGLANDEIYSIKADTKGNIWLGTRGAGLSCFDGKKFKNFSTQQGLCGNLVTCITEDKDGNFWFGTSNGLSFYNGLSFRNYTIEQGLPNNYISDIVIDSAGRIWIGTEGGLSCLKDQEFSNYYTSDGLPSKVISSLFIDHSGNLWIGTDSGFSRFDGQRFYAFRTSEGFPDKPITGIIQDNDGYLWLANWGSGIFRYDGRGFTTFTSTQGLSQNYVFGAIQDKKDNLWFFTQSKGINRFDGQNFTHFSTKQGLGGNSIWSMLENEDGSFWISNTEPGLSLFDGKKFTHFTPAQGLAHPWVWGINQDDKGRIWFSTFGGGVSVFDGKKFTNYTIKQGLPNNEVFCMTQDNQGNYWLGSNGGVTFYDGYGFANFTTKHGLPHNSIFNITKDKHGNLWLATEGGLSVISAENVKKWADYSYAYRNNQRQQDQERFLKMPNGFFKIFLVGDGLPHCTVTKVLELPGNKILTSTYQGIAIFDAPSGDFEHFNKLQNLEIFNAQTGYPVKDVNLGLHSLLLDKKGVLWVCNRTESTGLTRIDLKAFQRNQRIPKLSIRNILINEQAMPWYSLATESKAVSEKDSLHIPAYFTDEALTNGKVLNSTERDALHKKYSGIRFDSISKFYRIPAGLVLPYQHNRISIEFGTDHMARPSLVQYQYKLEGYDREWRFAQNKTTATFNNLSEGRYTFSVKARFSGASQGKGGSWSAPVYYRFKVKPPLHRSGLAYSLYLTLFLWAGWRLYDYQKQLTIRKEREKSREKELAQAKEIEKAYAELKSTQAQLVQHEKLASLGQLTAGIAHEIQNPLNFVNNFAEVSTEMIGEMKEEIKAGNTAEVIAIADDLEQNLSKINHHGQRASAIVKGMLEHSRVGTGVKESTDLNALADEYLRMAFQGFSKNNSFSARIETRFDQSLPKIEVIPQDIGRVLLNLLNNAFYATNEKANKKIEGYQATVTLSTKRLEHAIEISVQDNGDGIPETIKDKIFQPFFTTKPTGQGTGLGLSLAYDIVTKGHSGTLEVESQDGLGSTFIISLPVHNP